MFIYLLLFFIIVPLIELVILIKVGQYIGVLDTILIVITTGIIGASLAKHQGAKVIINIKNEISNGHLPAETLFDGFLIFTAGVLLITPGLLTDCLGFALLIPPLRAIIKERIRKKVESMISRKQIHIDHIYYDE